MSKTARAMSAVGISWPDITTPQSKAVFTRCPPLSMSIFDRPVPSPRYQDGQ